MLDVLIQSHVMMMQKVTLILFLNYGLKHQHGQTMEPLNLQIMQLKWLFKDPGTSFLMKMSM